MLPILWGSVGRVTNLDIALRDRIIPYEQDHTVQFRHFLLSLSLSLSLSRREVSLENPGEHKNQWSCIQLFGKYFT
jgi:hypothetical protein